MLTLVFFKPETAFKVSVPGEEIESSIAGDSINIVIDAALLVLTRECGAIDSLNAAVVFLCSGSS